MLGIFQAETTLFLQIKLYKCIIELFEFIVNYIYYF